jgi:hypothetical protein
MASAITARLRAVRPDVIADLPRAEILAPEGLPKRTWVGVMITARETGKPDPEPPSRAFDWL